MRSKPFSEESSTPDGLKKRVALATNLALLSALSAFELIFVDAMFFPDAFYSPRLWGAVGAATAGFGLAVVAVMISLWRCWRR